MKDLQVLPCGCYLVPKSMPIAEVRKLAKEKPQCDIGRRLWSEYKIIPDHDETSKDAALDRYCQHFHSQLGK